MDNFHGFADPVDAVDYGFLQFLGPDFGFWLLYCSHLGQRATGSSVKLLCVTLFLPCQSGFSVANMTFFRRRNTFGVIKNSKSRTYDFQSGCRNVSHQKQSFLGLHAARRSYTRRTTDSPGFQPFTINNDFALLRKEIPSICAKFNSTIISRI